MPSLMDAAVEQTSSVASLPSAVAVEVPVTEPPSLQQEQQEDCDGNGEVASSSHPSNSSFPIPVAPDSSSSSSEDGEGGAGNLQDATMDSNSTAVLTLEDAQRLYDQGCSSLRADDSDQATDLLSRSLEIRARHFGELAIECASTYYKYGCALLYKAQGESDALNEPPSADQQNESKLHENGQETGQAKEPMKGGEAGEEEELEEEEDSDLDLSWKMLDIARAIYEKQACHSIEEVDVVTALADVSLEREDFEMCFRDYTRALEILEGLVESDNRRIAELCFKLSLAQQLGYKPKEALKYCQQAVSVCEARLQRLRNQVAEANGTADSKGKSILSLEKTSMDSSMPDATHQMPVPTEEEAEIKEIEQLLEDLREKVVELEEMAAAPSLLDTLKETKPGAVSSIQQVFSAVAKLSDQGICSGSASLADASDSGFDTPSISASAPVTDLGIVGRGVKRATPISVSATADGHGVSLKKRSLDDMMTRDGAGATQIGFGVSTLPDGMTPSVQPLPNQPENM